MDNTIKIPEQESYEKIVCGDIIPMKKAKFNSLPYLYRADSRSHDTILKEGFIAKKPLSFEEVMADVRKIFCKGDNFLAQYVSGGADSCGNHYVSTADTPNCMGYSKKGTIYVISTDKICEFIPTLEVLGEQIEKQPNFGPRLYLDSDKLENSKFIGIRPKDNSSEIIVLGGIEKERVIGYTNSEDSKTFNLFE